MFRDKHSPWRLVWHLIKLSNITKLMQTPGMKQKNGLYYVIYVIRLFRNRALGIFLTKIISFNHLEWSQGNLIVHNCDYKLGCLPLHLNRTMTCFHLNFSTEFCRLESKILKFDGHKKQHYRVQRHPAKINSSQLILLVIKIFLYHLLFTPYVCTWYMPLFHGQPQITPQAAY